MSWKADYEKKKMTAEEAAKLIQSGDRIWATLGVSTPYVLLEAIGERRKELQDVTLYVHSMMKPLSWLDAESEEHIHVISGFIGPGERAAEKKGWKADTLAYQLYRQDEVMLRVVKANVGLLQLTPPDEKGYCYLGCSALGVKEVLETANLVIGQINSYNPAICTEDLCVHVSQLDAVVEADEPLPLLGSAKPDETDKKVAAHIVELVPDGATLQIGVGSISNAVGYYLEHHKDLGIHTELYTDSMMYLTKKGAVNHSKKVLYPGKAVMGLAGGSKEMYEFLNNNPTIINKNIEWVNDPKVIAQNNNMISINACIGIDLLGQVSSESFGFRQYSGSGGQLDFVRGAQKSPGGKSFLAMRSTVEKKDGTVLSKITLTHPIGSAITVPRTDVEYVCTEYGVVNLQNQSIDYRARALISIAHPDFRDSLTFEAKKAGILH